MQYLPIHHENTDPDFAQLSEFIISEMRRLQVPGVAVGLLHNGRQHLAGFGVTSVENPLPVTADTLFQIGSTTKTITGTIVMRLVERGQLDLDRPVRDYLPDLRLRDKEAEATVTMRHLLIHMGGWTGDFFRETGSGDDCLARYVAEMAGLEQVVPVGAIWSYNNAGFGLAGRVIEVVTGRPYEVVAQELVLDPLGMDNSFFAPADVISRRFAVGHRVDEKEGLVVERPWALARAANPVGGLCSSARDQLRYAAFHLGDGATPDGERLLAPETMAAMQTPCCPANLGRQMGLSWLLREIDGTRIVLHGGATNGQLSAFLFVPSRGFALTVLTNAEEGSMLNDEVTKWALAHYLDLREPEMNYLTLSDEELAVYAGTYEAQMTTLALVVEDGQMIVRATPKGGFPDVDSPPSPAPPPSRLAFFAPDAAIALDPPLINMKAEFLQDDQGRVTWLRTSRLHKKGDRG